MRQWNSLGWRGKAAVLLALTALLDMVGCYALAFAGRPTSGPYVIPYIVQIFLAMLGAG